MAEHLSPERAWEHDADAAGLGGDEKALILHGLRALYSLLHESPTAFPNGIPVSKTSEIVNALRALAGTAARELTEQALSQPPEAWYPTTAAEMREQIGTTARGAVLSREEAKILFFRLPEPTEGFRAPGGIDREILISLRAKLSAALEQGAS